MDAEMIGLIIKWGPLALVGVIFLFYFIRGLIKGTYKVTRRIIYVLLFCVLSVIFVGDLTNFVLDLDIEINGVQGVRNFLIDLIESNEDINGFLKYSPDLKSLIIDHPEIILSPIVLIVLLLVVLPLSFPIYWIYVLIWNLIAKYACKREKYQKDEMGNIIRNEKGKKIKVHRKKRRLLGGLIYGVQGVFVFSVILLPVNFVNRIYNKAKESADLKEGETLCSSIEFAELNDDICNYIDMYNETIFAKVGGEKSLDKFINDKLTTVEVEGEKVSLENELSSLAVSAVLINESGLLKLLVDGVNLDTLDLSVIDFEKINLALDKLFNSYTLQKLSEAGVNYVLNEVLNDKLVELFKDNDIVSKLEYDNAAQIKEELQSVVNIIKYAVDKNIDNLIIDNQDNVIGVVNGISETDVEALVNKLLSLRIVSQAMPSVLKAYGEEYGINVPENMTSELNNEIANNFGNAVKFVQTMQASSIEDITEGDIVENLSTLLFNNGVLKENTKDSLATLLNDFNNSYLFKDLIPTLANDLLKSEDYKIDARVLRYVTNKEAWLKELTVLEKGFDIYLDYKDSESIYYDKVVGLLNEVSGTKVMISILPFAYNSLLPELGLEVDDSLLPEINFDESNENSSKEEFYEIWEEELILLKNIADAFGDLGLQSLEDISVDILNDDDKVESLSTVMGEVYKSDMLREPFVDFMKDTLNEFVSEFGIKFSKEELLTINTKDKWHNEFSNINEVLSVDFSDTSNIDSTSLKTVFDAVGAMELFKSKKITILKYAVENSGMLEQDELGKINWPTSTDQDEIDKFFDDETSILLKVVDRKDKILSLSDIDLDTMEDSEVEEIGNLVDDIMKSNILNPVVTSKMVSIFTSDDVNIRNDNDEEASNSELEASISTIGVEDGTSWVDELKIIKGMLTITESNINEEVQPGITRVEKMFADIDDSDLLSGMKANILMKALGLLNMSEAKVSNVNVGVLKADDYAQYDKEVAVIVSVSKNKAMFDGLEGMELETVDAEVMGDLLNKIMNSKVFSDFAVTKLSDIFKEEGIKPDDTSVSLETSISNIGVVENTSWVDELTIVKGMLTMTESDIGEEISGVTKIEKMFSDIEKSALLSNMRANILMKAVTLLEVDGVNTTYVSVASLKENNYTQYDNETDVLIKFAENKSEINELVNIDISDLDDNSKKVVAELLNSIKLSDIFKDKYVSLLDGDGNTTGALTVLRKNADLASYGVSIKTKADTNYYRNIDWEGEIASIDVITANIGTLKAYNNETIKKDTDYNTVVSVATTIGDTLDAIAASDLLSDGADKVIANKVIKQITGVTPNPELTNENASWTDVFTNAINAYIVGLNYQP